MTGARIRHTGAMATFGERLRDARLAAGYTRADLVREIGISLSELKRLESLEARPEGSRYLAQIERTVRFENVTDPRVSQATEMELVEALRRRIAARQPYGETPVRRSLFEVDDTDASNKLIAPDADSPDVTRGAPTEQPSSATGVDDVRRGGDGGPPPGVVEA